ncbi:MAG: GNAT family N-acetyltransferase [Actinomycetota bacterium]
MGDVRIVRAGPERIDDLEALWRALHKHHRAVGPEIPGAPWRDGDDAWRRRRANYAEWLRDPAAFALIAEDGERPVAYALVSPHAPGDDTNVTGERFAELKTLSVEPGYRNVGLGKRMMQRVYQELRALGVREMVIGVIVGNEGAMRFYEREGFRPWVVLNLGTIPEPD